MMGRHMAIGKDTVVVQVTSGKKVIIPSKSKLGTLGTKVYHWQAIMIRSIMHHDA
jgi:hypothetical protein